MIYKPTSSLNNSNNDNNNIASNEDRRTEQIKTLSPPVFGVERVIESAQTMITTKAIQTHKTPSKQPNPEPFISKILF
ncbi:hypothetical protein RHGRI_022903 [Rhododendron griersonianum]|uniref:Uncharacterized protein n=1 Tax=Rhododendron griersonianum TaxID=479676 RepID=A0AAV6J1B1_9ERIC|nr:hypothetical protein RHGRI_022903 [Rhododendron griersonianum]